MKYWDPSYAFTIPYLPCMVYGCCFPKIWGWKFPPKWMVYNYGKPYVQMDDLGGFPIIFGNAHIYLHEWLKFMVNVGKYTSPMDPMGIDVQFAVRVSLTTWRF